MRKFFTQILSLAATAMVAVTVATPARADVQIDVQGLQQALTLEAATAGLNWKVGDRASYKIGIGGFINGTSDNSVREDTGTHFWMVQDMDLKIQKQKVEAMINKTNGQIEKLLVNGQEQEIPKSGEQEIIEMKESRVTVPAGEFDCIYAKIKDKTSGNITEAWINPQVVPMSGMLKALADSQFGKVTQEVTSFQFAPR